MSHSRSPGAVQASIHTPGADPTDCWIGNFWTQDPLLCLLQWQSYEKYFYKVNKIKT